MALGGCDRVHNLLPLSFQRRDRRLRYRQTGGFSMAIQAKCSETALDCKITIKGDNERDLIDSARKHFRTSHRLPDLGAWRHWWG